MCWHPCKVVLFLCCMLIACACAQQEISYNITTIITGLNNPFGVAVNSIGEVVVADTVNHRILKRDVFGTLLRIAGGTYSGFSGDGVAINSWLNFPYGVTLLPNGDVLIADSGNNIIRKVSEGTISTIAGNVVRGYQGDGGLATSASLHYPYSVAIGLEGEFFISDTVNQRIRMFTQNSTISTVVGGSSGYNGDGILALSASLNTPGAIAFGSKGELYIADTNNHRIRKVVNNTIYTIAGTSSKGYNGDGILATDAMLNSPYGVAVNSFGEIIFSDTNNHRIRKISTNGYISTIAGTGSYGFGGDGGLANFALLNSPNGVAVGPNDEIFFTDNGNNRVRKLVYWCPSDSFFKDGFCETKPIHNCYGIPFTNSSVCSGSGECIANDTCKCFQGYFGSTCFDSFSCFGIANKTACSGHGKCTYFDNCTCNGGYYGETCEKFDCFSISPSNTSVCSSRGTCTSYNTCNCLNGFYGSKCEKYDCYGSFFNNTNVCSGHGQCISPNNCTCENGYFDANCESFNCAGERFTNDTVCKNNGTCYGPFDCSCPSGFGGSKCEYHKCFSLLENDLKVCSGHGACIAIDNCSCSTNWFGSNCSITTCFNISSNSSVVCNQRGRCSDYNNCNCSNGFSGNQCQNTICYGKIDSETTSCSGNGKCVAPNNCSCKTGFIGNECQYHQVYLNISSAMIHSSQETLMKLLPIQKDIFSCFEIFDESEIRNLGENPVSCQWRAQSFRIFLGYDYSIKHGSVLQTKLGFSIQIFSLTSSQIEALSPTCSFGYSLSENTPLLDVVIRLNCEEDLHTFKRLKTTWTCDECPETISSLLSNYTNKSAIYIPVSYTNSLNPVQGYRTIKLHASTLNSLSISRYVTKDIKIQSYTKLLPPSFYWLSDNYVTGKMFSCIGHNCIIETSLNSMNSSLSFSFSGFFSLLNADLNSKQMSRLINVYSGEVLDSEFYSNMQIFGVQLKTYAFLPLIIENFKYSTFSNLDYVMTGVNRSYSIYSGNDVTISLSIDDPFVSRYTISDYLSFSWSCFRVSDLNKTIVLTNNLCSSNSNTLKFDNKLSGLYLISAYVSSTKYFITTNFKYEGYITLVDNSPDSPSVTTDYIPAITPSHKGIKLRSVVKSKTAVSYLWSVKLGKLNIFENSIEFLQRNSKSKHLVGNHVEIILEIENRYLIQGEEYQIELITFNENGNTSVSFSTRIDFTPRLSCDIENLKNENNFTSFESLVFISCIKLPYESISSFKMEFLSQDKRLGIISNTPKKALITRIPYSPDESVSLVVNLQNLYGSIGYFTKDIKIGLPQSFPSENSIALRLNFIINQFIFLKNSQPVRLESSNEINVLLSLLIQNETLSSFTNRALTELKSNQISTLNTLLNDMLIVIKSVQGITYKVDEKVIQLVLPIVSKISVILSSTLDKTSLTEFASDLEKWLDWIYSGMNKAIDYYPKYIYQDLLDSAHVEELKALQNILLFIYQNNIEQQYKTTIYKVQYTKLTGLSIDNTSLIENVEFSEMLNGKAISLQHVNFTVDVKFPSDFSNQISLSSQTKMFYTIYTFNDSNIDSNMLQNKPIIDLSLLNSEFSIITVKNIDPPITMTFRGLMTTNKTSVNASCIYYDTSVGKWSTSGIETKTIINMRTDEHIYFDIECHSSHLSLFSVQEQLTSETLYRSERFSSESNTLTIVLASVIPASIVIIAIIIFLIIVVIVYFRQKQKKESKDVNIELSYSDFPLEGSMFIKPLMSVSSNGSAGEEFNPLSRYSDLIRIGQGAFGSVFKAYDNKTSSVKALKVIRYNSMEELNTLMKEGSQLMNVNHPHILRVNEFFVSKDNLLCIDMDFYELGDLVKLTNPDYYCSEPLIKQIIFQMCEALVFIHSSMKIIHRDIKPSNIFIKSLEKDNIHIILADFGLAKSNIGSTNNSYAGTPIFMSPELGLGGKYYYNTDIYSLGVTIYQIMTKDTITSISQLYFSKELKEASLVLRKTINNCERFSEQLIEIVLLMLTKDNVIRPQAQDILDHPYFDDLKLSNTV